MQQASGTRHGCVAQQRIAVTARMQHQRRLLCLLYAPSCSGHLAVCACGSVWQRLCRSFTGQEDLMCCAGSSRRAYVVFPGSLLPSSPSPPSLLPCMCGLSPGPAGCAGADFRCSWCGEWYCSSVCFIQDLRVSGPGVHCLHAQCMEPWTSHIMCDHSHDSCRGGAC